MTESDLFAVLLPRPTSGEPAKVYVVLSEGHRPFNFDQTCVMIRHATISTARVKAQMMEDALERAMGQNAKLTSDMIEGENGQRFLINMRGLFKRKVQVEETRLCEITFSADDIILEFVPAEDPVSNRAIDLWDISVVVFVPTLALVPSITPMIIQVEKRTSSGLDPTPSLN